MSIFSNRFSDAKQEAGDYTKAILGLLGDQDPMAVLERTPNELTKRIAGLSPEQLSKPEAPGKWSMRQVVRHLADSELIWGYRVRRILADDRPAIEGYDQDNWAARLRYERADLDESLAQIRALRASNLSLIRSLDAAQLKRVGVHSERGEESIEHLIRMYAGHDILHLNQLARIRKTVS
jgi:uncharacterized damage-inducible protein DinB